MVFDQKRNGVTYRISRAVEGEEFATLLFEPSESLERICPRRNSNRIHCVSVHEVGHGEVGQGSIGIAVNRELVPDLSNEIREIVREK